MLMTDYAIIHSGQSTLSLLASSDYQQIWLSTNLLMGKDYDSEGKDDVDNKW